MFNFNCLKRLFCISVFLLSIPAFAVQHQLPPSEGRNKLRDFVQSQHPSQKGTIGRPSSVRPRHESAAFDKKSAFQNGLHSELAPLAKPGTFIKTGVNQLTRGYEEARQDGKGVVGSLKAGLAATRKTSKVDKAEDKLNKAKSLADAYQKRVVETQKSLEELKENKDDQAAKPSAAKNLYLARKQRKELDSYMNKNAEKIQAGLEHKTYGNFQKLQKKMGEVQQLDQLASDKTGVTKLRAEYNQLTGTKNAYQDWKNQDNHKNPREVEVALAKGRANGQTVGILSKAAVETGVSTGIAAATVGAAAPVAIAATALTGAEAIGQVATAQRLPHRVNAIYNKEGLSLHEKQELVKEAEKSTKETREKIETAASIGKLGNAVGGIGGAAVAAESAAYLTKKLAGDGFAVLHTAEAAAQTTTGTQGLVRTSKEVVEKIKTHPTENQLKAKE
jgi:hypothetical protein